MPNEAELKKRAKAHGQEHIFRFWDELNDEGRARLLQDVARVDFQLMDRLVKEWVQNAPEPEHFAEISPVPAIPQSERATEKAREAWEAGEEALRQGRVGLFLVAGGQGTRLGFNGPKGAYPIGALTGKSIFQYHAEKVVGLQRRYGCCLPWYIMVSETNEQETREYFKKNEYFGLGPENIFFFVQSMVPCVDETGKFLLDAKDALAKNPNGHGGAIPAMVENGVLEDALDRGVDTLSYFQVDNWAVKVADPLFIGYHVLNYGEMSSKVHRKHEPREAVGVHCLCDGEYRVIEYSELDIYPQLLEKDPQGGVVFSSGNPAIHIINTDFAQRVYDKFSEFPWHRAHKKVPYVDEQGRRVEPEKPNAFKFETFIFDALRYTSHAPIALEIEPLGEYTPTKQFEGDNSVVAARRSMARLWGSWLEAAGATVPRDAKGEIAVQIEISPSFALTQEEFLERTQGREWGEIGDIAIDADGELEDVEVEAA